MEMTERTCLHPDQSIVLSTAPGGKPEKRFSVMKITGEGSRAVCYAVKRERDGRKGRLKEFYPLEDGTEWPLEGLCRQQDGQLAFEGREGEEFLALCRDYISVYPLLNEIYDRNPRNEILKNYLESYEILYGCPQKGVPTVYLWSVGLAGKSFEDFLREIRKAPEKDADHHLHDILRTMITLTDGVKALHTAGLLHLDIKPSNFLVPFDSDLQINPGQISLFDLDSLYHVGEGQPAFLGTAGYCAPELWRGKADNRSDLYSIGAMLFTSIILTDREQNETGEVSDREPPYQKRYYREEDYHEMNQLVRHSALMRGAESNSDVALMSMLADILKKCLAKNPRNRYQSCTQLLKDLRRAELRSKQYAVAPGLLGENQRLAIIEVQKSNPALIMQKLLHDDPLFDALGEEEKKIRILILGAGTYGQRFCDICLQAGQMRGYSLEVTFVTKHPSRDRDRYLQFRPGLTDFVEMDGEANGKRKQTYASLRFQDASSDAWLTDLLEGPSCQSVFAALENDEEDEADPGEDHSTYDRKNQEQARFLAARFSSRKGFEKCRVFYLQKVPEFQREEEMEPQGEAKGLRLIPVRIFEPVSARTIDPRLEQMAFRAHRVWDPAPDQDPIEALLRFREDKYQYASSLAFVLSIRYKLYSIGIRTADAAEAAKRFEEEVLRKRKTDPEARKKYDALVALEHRRWVLEKVMDGWTAPRKKDGTLQLEECVWRGSVKDEKKRTHPCLVCSTETAPLKEEAYQRDHHQKWEDPQIDPALDDLDRMSLELHQCFQRYARMLCASRPLEGEDFTTLRLILAKTPGSVSQAFSAYESCLKNILDREEDATRQYHSIRRALEEALMVLDQETRKKALELIRRMTKAFFPLMEANLYRNYKANDEALIEKIPYILAHRYHEAF